MTIQFNCPHCDAPATVAQEFAGRLASCVRCGRQMTVPNAWGQATTSAELDALSRIARDRPRFRLGRLLLWLGGAVCLLCCIGVVVLPLGRAREAARRMSCSSNFKQIALAMHNYHDVYGCFPPAFTTDENGRPMHSWRVFLLPYIEQQLLYQQYDFDQPWDSPHNIELLTPMPPIFRCPSADTQDGFSNYVVIIGDPDKFPQTVFAPDRSVSISDVTDGTSNTVMIVEVERGVPWTMPGADLRFDQMTFRINDGPAAISSAHPEVVQVALADGSVSRLYDSLAAETLRRLLQPADGKPIEDHAGMFPQW